MDVPHDICSCDPLCVAFKFAITVSTAMQSGNADSNGTSRYVDTEKIPKRNGCLNGKAVTLLTQKNVAENTA